MHTRIEEIQAQWSQKGGEVMVPSASLAPKLQLVSTTFGGLIITNPPDTVSRILCRVLCWLLPPHVEPLVRECPG